MSIVLRSGSATDRGKVRPTNQDCVLEGKGVFAVADGMGGHAGGEVAARTAIDTIREEFVQGNGEPDRLARSVKVANSAIWARAGSDRSLRGMGTTLVGLAIAKDPVNGSERIVLANVGDSRAYVLRNGGLLQLTSDHTVVEDKLRAREITAEEAARHPHRHILTRALGTEPNVEVDAWQFQPAPGERYLLCSDGLFNEVNDAEIAALLGRKSEPGEAATRLVDLARAHGGSDNISVVVVDVVTSDPNGAGADPDPPGRTGNAPSTAASASGLAGGAFSAAMMGMAGSPRAEVPQPPLPTGRTDPPEPPPPADAPDPPDATSPPDPSGAGTGSGTTGPGEEPATIAQPRVPIPRSPSLPFLTSAGEGMSSVMADVLRAADHPDWPGLTAAVPGLGAGNRVGATRLDQLYAASERAAALRDADRQEALRDSIRFNESKEKRRLPHFVSLRRERPLPDGQEVGGDGGTPVFTWRVAGFLLLLFLIVAGAFGSVVWFAQNSYYVGLDGNHLAVFQGRPGGLAWFQPHLLHDSSVTADQVLPSRLAELHAGVIEPSASASDAYIRNLTAERTFALQGGAAPAAPSPSSAITTPPGAPSGGGTAATSEAPTSSEPVTTTSTTAAPTTTTPASTTTSSP